MSAHDIALFAAGVPFFMIIIATISLAWLVSLVFIIHFSAKVFELIGAYVSRFLEKAK